MEGVTYKELKALLPGPKGWKGSQTVSRAKIDTPSFLWVVTTMRVLGSGDAIVDLVLEFEVSCGFGLELE